MFSIYSLYINSRVYKLALPLPIIIIDLSTYLAKYLILGILKYLQVTRQTCMLVIQFENIS